MSLASRLMPVAPSTMVMGDLIALDVDIEDNITLREVAMTVTSTHGTLVCWANGDPLVFVPSTTVVWAL